MIYSPEMFRETIAEYIAKMNINWFLKKEQNFKAHPDYDKEHDLIIVEVEDYSENPLEFDKNGFPSKSEIVDCSYTIKIDLKRYCSLYLPIDEITHWGDFALDECVVGSKVSSSNNSDEYAHDLIKDIGSFLKEGSDNVETHKFTSIVLDTIEEELKKSKALSTNNSVYVAVLDDFLKRCTDIIYRKYSRELTLHKMLDGYVGKLEFSLNQDQLAALLFILSRAGFFTYTDNTSLLKFAHNHFLYKNEDGKMVSPSSLKNFQKKYSDVVVSQSPKSKQEISHKGLNEVEKILSFILAKLQ